MIALVALFVVVITSLLVVRIGAIALTMTGLSKDLATFQAQSAFSGVGFTTGESEFVMSHPVRRTIIRILMLMGTAGVTSAIVTLVLTFYRGGGLDIAIRLGIIVAGLVVLWVASSSRAVNRIMTRIIQAALTRWTDLQIRDYAKLLEIAEGYTVSEIQVGATHWLCDKTVGELKLNREGVLVLGVRKTDGIYYGVVTGDLKMESGDKLTCYGGQKVLRELASRSRGK